VQDLLGLVFQFPLTSILVTSIDSSFFFMTEDSMAWMGRYVIFTRGWTLGWCQLLAITNETHTSIHVQASAWILVFAPLDECPGKTLLSWRTNKCLVFKSLLCKVVVRTE
jgi:hypothetical protein